MTHVSIDIGRCAGQALCMGIAPEVFEVGEDDLAHVLIAPGPEHDEEVADAVRSCPNAAILLQQ